MIGKIQKINNINEALDLIKESYLQIIKDEDSILGQKYFIEEYLGGKENFDKFFKQELTFYGYYVLEKLVGVISIDINKYIKFLFVEKEFLRKGIGKNLLTFVIEKCEKGDVVRLDASLYSVEFYKRFGFREIRDVQESKDMNYIPMKYEV